MNEVITFNELRELPPTEASFNEDAVKETVSKCLIQARKSGLTHVNLAPALQMDFLPLCKWRIISFWLNEAGYNIKGNHDGLEMKSMIVELPQ